MPSLLLRSFCLLLPATSALAQYADGELIVRLGTAGGGSCSYLRVDPVTGNATTLLAGAYPHGYSGSAVYDSFRDVMLINTSLPPDSYALARLFAVQADGSHTAVAAVGTGELRGLCSVGDGRVFYQVHQTPEIRWLDASNQVHTLLDASGSAPFQFAIEHLIYHAPSNALIATTSGWWSSNDCSPGSCSVFRIPLSNDGSRVGGPVACAPVASDNQEIMSLDFMPGGQLLMCLANGSPGFMPLLYTVDPTTLAMTAFANTQLHDLDGAVYSTRAGGAIVLDDGGNTLRQFGPGTTLSLGTVIPTSLPVSAITSGYSPAENLWEVDRNGPGCQGLGAPYGTGLAGLGGVVPTLGAVGCPDRSTPWSLSVNATVGGTFGLLALGDGPANLPALGGSLLIFPVTATFVFATSGAPGMPGVGGFNLPLLLTDPALVGISFWFQAVVLDAAGVEGFSLSNGLQVVIG